MKARRTKALLIGGVTVAAAVAAAAAIAAYAQDRPSISFDSTVPDDVRRLASGTWDRFVDAFPARRECLRSVQLTVAWTYPDRAAYDQDRKLVTLRVPGTAPNLQPTLAHEFGHHLDVGCADSSAIRSIFLKAQGFPPGTPWFDGPAWETTPSEQFAEAVAQVVTGHPPIHQRVVLSPAALDLVRDWARRDPEVGGNAMVVPRLRHAGVSPST
jgi:hypothetical protein